MILDGERGLFVGGDVEGAEGDSDFGVTRLRRAGELVVIGPVKGSSGAILFGVARTQSALIFTDGFERGSDDSWPETAP